MASSTSLTQIIKYDPNLKVTDQFLATSNLSVKNVGGKKGQPKTTEKTVQYVPFIMDNLLVTVYARTQGTGIKNTTTYRITYKNNFDDNSPLKEESVPAAQLEETIKKIYQPAFQLSQLSFRLIETIEKFPIHSEPRKYDPSNEEITKQLSSCFSYQIFKTRIGGKSVVFECAEQYAPLIVNKFTLEISAHWHAEVIGSKKPKDENNVTYHITYVKNTNQGDRKKAVYKKENVSGTELSKKITETYLKSFTTRRQKQAL